MNKKLLAEVDQTAISLIHEFCLQGKTMEQLWAVTRTNWHYRSLVNDLAIAIRCHKEAINGSVYRLARGK